MNLYIVEDSELIQQRLLDFVSTIPGVQVIGMAADIATASNELIQHEADACILDLQLKDGSGLQLLKAVKQHKPGLKVVVLTNHASEANRIYALRAGADGFLDKSTDFENLQTYLSNWQQQDSSIH